MFNFDQTFIDKLKAQDHAAFNTFYLESVDYFFRYIQANYYISEQDSHDIIADFYVKRWHAATKYDGRSSFSYYIWMIFKNIIKDYFKKNSDLAFSQIKTAEGGTPFEDNLEYEDTMKKLLEADYTYEHILQAIQSLNENEKEAIFLKYIEEKSTSDIADICGVPEATMRKRLSRAIQNLKSLLSTEIP